MHKRIKAAIAATTLGLVLTGAGVAHAETTQDNGSDALVVQPTTYGRGEAYVWWVDGSGDPVSSKTTPAYAKAEFFDYQTGYTLNGWLERSTDGRQSRAPGLGTD